MLLTSDPMLFSRRLAVTLGFALLPLLGGCAEERPRIERWTGCVFENATRAMEHGDTLVKPGTGAFLYAYATWRPTRFEGDQYMGELEIDFPGALAAGMAREFSGEPEYGRTVAYRERFGRSGSPALGVQSIYGKVEVQRSDARSVTFTIDIFTDKVDVDHFRLGPATFKGTIEARKVSSMRECYAQR